MSLTKYKTELQPDNGHESLTCPQPSTVVDQFHPRQGETTNQARFRANRLFSSGAAWYFSTREGRDQGPFISKEQAELAVSEYIKKFQY